MNIRSFLVVSVGLSLIVTTALADENRPRRAPMPEPLLTETVTDIDGHEAGEIEFEANFSQLGSSRGGARVLQAALEVEMLLTRALGARVGPLLSYSRDANVANQDLRGGGNAGVSWKLLQDFQRDLHLQVELSGRYPWDVAKYVEVGEPALPFALDLRGGIRRGPLTIRASIGVTAGGTAAYAPVRGSLGFFTPFGNERFGFCGIELDVDAARLARVAVALNFVPSLIPVGLPLKLGLAIPWAIGTPDAAPSFGLLLRVWVESSREVDFGRHERHGPQRPRNIPV